MIAMVDVLFRTSAVLAIGFGAAAGLRRRSAAVRHLVLAGAMLAAAAVLPLGQALPAWEVRVPALPGAPAAPPAGAGWLPPDVSVGGEGPPAEDTRPFAVPIVAFWALGFALAGASVLRDLGRLARVSRSADRVREGRPLAVAARLAATFGVRREVALLYGRTPGLVATWGLFRPRVLLPADARDWNDDRLQAVLGHELAHISRGDWAVQMCAEAVRIVFWFNPLFWLAGVRLRRESEQACDDAVLKAGMPGPEYATHLIEVARLCRRSVPALAAAVPMARPSTLERRVAAMLNGSLNRNGVSRRAALAAAALLLALSGSIAALRATQDGPLPLRGAIFDPSGAVLPDVRLALIDAQDVAWEVTTDAAGQFEFAAVQPGSYVLEAKLMGFRTLRQAFELRATGDWNRAITLQVGDLSETVTVSASRMQAPSPPERPQPVRVGGNIRVPKKVHHVNPVYPISMREAAREGVVPIEAVIGTDGNVTSQRVLSAHVHPDFADAAVDAVRQWRFTPTLLNGSPVEVRMTVQVEFRLSN